MLTHVHVLHKEMDFELYKVCFHPETAISAILSQEKLHKLHAQVQRGYLNPLSCNWEVFNNIQSMFYPFGVLQYACS